MKGAPNETRTHLCRFANCHISNFRNRAIYLIASGGVTHLCRFANCHISNFRNRAIYLIASGGVTHLCRFANCHILPLV